MLPPPLWADLMDFEFSECLLKSLEIEPSPMNFQLFIASEEREEVKSRWILKQIPKTKLP